MTDDCRDLAHLRRCLEHAGDDPFGSVLAGPDGEVLAEDHNHETTSGDPTAHPERARPLGRGQPVGGGAGGLHRVHVGRALPDVLGRARLGRPRPDCLCRVERTAGGLAGRLGLPAAPVAALPAGAVVPGIVAVGPVPPFDEQVRLLHERSARRKAHRAR